MIWPFRARSKTLEALDLAAMQLAQARAKRIVAQANLLAALDGLEPGATLKVNGVHNGKGKEGCEVQGRQVPQGQDREAGQPEVDRGLR